MGCALIARLYFKCNTACARGASQVGTKWTDASLQSEWKLLGFPAEWLPLHASCLPAVWESREEKRPLCPVGFGAGFMERAGSAPGVCGFRRQALQCVSWCLNAPLFRETSLQLRSFFFFFFRRRDLSDAAAPNVELFPFSANHLLSTEY